jgi:hypothetical protein
MSIARAAVRSRGLRTVFCLTLAVAARSVAAAADAAPAPAAAPSPLPSLALSSKPGPGCCCITTAPGKAPACTDGLQEAACRSASRAVAHWTGTWAEGKCPPP